MSGVSRRSFVVAGLAALPGLAGMPKRLLAFEDGPRTLDFSHTHTGEALAVEYWARGTYLPDALEAVNRLLRDFRTGDVHPIDPGLLDMLHAVARITGSRKPFQVISGFRSPHTNTLLRERGGGGVAVGSLHMVGKAIDIRVGDVPLVKLRNAALSLKVGGVGYYPGSAFVHVDTGRVRQWSG
jgi:uncharacterized protein YcbK (DUF882 family)